MLMWRESGRVLCVGARARAGWLPGGLSSDVGWWSAGPARAGCGVWLPAAARGVAVARHVPASGPVDERRPGGPRVPGHIQLVGVAQLRAVLCLQIPVRAAVHRLLQRADDGGPL